MCFQHNCTKEFKYFLNSIGEYVCNFFTHRNTIHIFSFSKPRRNPILASSSCLDPYVFHKGNNQIRLVHIWREREKTRRVDTISRLQVIKRQWTHGDNSLFPSEYIWRQLSNSFVTQ